MIIKRVFVILINVFLMVSAFATNKDLEKDVTMISYEQGWLDYQGTLALKNNTNEEIRNVKFQITYLDMAGNPLDYEEYMKYVSIAPKMTKKLDIPAYEHDRNYHYYKSENMPGGSPSFKIKFQLKDYNVEKRDTEDLYADNSFEGFDYRHSDEKDNNKDSYYVIIVLVAMLFVVGISVGTYVLVAVMAQRRNRSVVLWVLLSLLATPLLMIIILLCIGKDERLLKDQM